MSKHVNINFPNIDGIIVDILALISINYSCDPKLCNGQKSCCASYDVCIEECDVEKIIPYFPGASYFAPHIISGDSFINLFSETDDGLISLDTDENGQCLLAWKNESGNVLCSLHSHALKNNLSFYSTKPKSCCLWPLAESDTSTKSLTIDDDCLNFPCVTKKEIPDFIICKEVALIIENIYGIDLINQINLYIKENIDKTV